MPAVLQPPGAGGEHILPVPNPILPYPGFDDPGAPDVIPNPYLPGGPGGGKLPPDLTPTEPTDPTIEQRIEAMNNYDGSRRGVVSIPPSNNKFDENSHEKYYVKESQPETLEDYLKKYANIITIAVGVLAIVTFLRK